MKDSTSNSTWSQKTKIAFCLCVIASGVYTFYCIFPLTFHFKYSLNVKKSSKLKWLQNDTSACLLPKLDPFDESIQKYIIPPDKYNCTKNFHLLFYTDLESNLILNKSLEKADYESCCYSKLSRGKSDKEYLFSKECHPIVGNSTKIPTTMDFIGVYCQKKNKSLTFLVDLFGLIHPKAKVKQEIGNRTLPLPTNKFSERKNSVNVVILGTDAVSHMNFIRTMPKTYAFLTGNLSAVAMHGFTKVGDSSFPNLFAALTGKSDYQVSWDCKTDYYDECPIIWKSFAKQGHRTMFIEDAPESGIFNYYGNGFKQPPTDYYFTPLTTAQDFLIAHAPVTSIYRLCYGPRLSFEILLDYIKKAAYTFRNRERYFQFIWSTITTHDKINNAGIGDDLLFQTLKWLHYNNYLNETVFILMSDHGMRYGPIRTTYQGSVEERMPYFIAAFPSWFSKKYKTAMKNFWNNSKRLTTHFDIYETLKDLADLQNIEEKKLIGRSEVLQKKITRGISWFLPVPINRTCYDAAIPDHFCVCHKMKNVPVGNNTAILKMSEEVVKSINFKLSKSPQCTPLKLINITRAQTSESLSADVQQKIDKEGSHQSTYVVNLVTSPGNATFEATVSRNNLKENWIVADFISRTNWYTNQSYCIKDQILKKYCFCKLDNL